MTTPFNPLDMANLGLSITTAILGSAPTNMSELGKFTGAGIYAIYYTGDAPMYALLSAANQEGAFRVPIYVGKAVPTGSRKGVLVDATATTRALSSRLSQHAARVASTQSLVLEDFWCRTLVVEPIWIPLGESILISRTVPIWNSLVDGFGNHDPGAGRREGVRSRWDTLHPGDGFARMFPARTESAEDIEADVQEYLRQRFQV